MKNTIMAFSLAVFVLVLSMSSAEACVGKPLTEQEVLNNKNSLVVAALSQHASTLSVNGFSLENVTSITFDKNFSISRGIRGNCEAIVANGNLYVNFGSECRATYDFSSASDALRITQSVNCH